MAGRVLSQDRYKYTPADFDENGEFKRNPNYMMGPLQAQAVRAGEAIDTDTFDLQQQYQANLRAEADANRPYKVLETEDQAQRLANLMKADGARQRMGEEAWKRRVNTLKAWRDENPKPGTNIYPSLNTSPLPTGIPSLDYAGQSVPSKMADGPYAKFTEATTTYPELPKDMPSDHPDAMRLQRAREGVDMTSGGPLKTRAALALAPAIPEMKAKKLRSFFEEYRSELPPDLQDTPVMYDAMLQELLFLQPDKEEEGKWRWTTMEGTGIELGDLGDMMDPAEILSLAGSVAATVLTPQGKVGFAGKMFTMGRKGMNARYAVTGFEGGLGGRLLGEATKIGIEYIRSNGKSYPTYEQMRRAGWTAANIELFATVSGELGAKILRTGSNIIQDRLAQLEGKVGVQHMSEREVLEANQNIMTAKADMEQAKDVLGEYRIAMTIGDASGNIRLIDQQQSGLKNASTKTRTLFNSKKADSDRALQDYVETVWGTPHPLGDTLENTIVRANDIVQTNGRLAILQTADETIHIVPRPRRDPNTGEIVTDVPTNFGIQIEIKGAQNNAWQVKSSKLSDPELDLTNTHIGYQMYHSAHKEAQMNGGYLVSDHSVSGRAVAMWERLGQEEGVVVKRNPKAKYDSTSDQWETFGEPMFEVVPQRSYTEALLDSYPATTVPGKPRINTKTGEMTEGVPVYKDEHFDAHLHGEHGGAELAQIKQDTALNPYIKQRYKEMVLKNYEKHVLDPKTGQPKAGAYEKWLSTARPRMEAIFSPEEMFAVEKMQLRRIVEGTRTGLDTMGGAINRIVDIDLGDLSKSGGLLSQATKAKLVNQMRNLDGRDVRRLFKMFDNVPGVPRGEFGDHIRSIVEDDLKNEILKKAKGTDYIGMDEWMKANEDLLHNIWPENAGEQMMHLRMVRDMVNRRYQSGAVQGMATDQNPTGLALTRVIFGPLSRAQRFFSAARRGQVRGGAAKATDIIMDPAELRQFARIRSMPLESRIVARVVQDAGGWDMFPVDINEWIPMAPDGTGGQEFDANNPEHRKALAAYIMNLIAREEDYNAENNIK